MERDGAEQGDRSALFRPFHVASRSDSAGSKAVASLHVKAAQVVREGRFPQIEPIAESATSVYSEAHGRANPSSSEAVSDAFAISYEFDVANLQFRGHPAVNFPVTAGRNSGGKFLLLVTDFPGSALPAVPAAAFRSQARAGDQFMHLTA